VLSSLSDASPFCHRIHRGFIVDGYHDIGYLAAVRCGLNGRHDLISRWEHIRGRILWIIAIAFALVLAIFLLRIGYAYKWTGFGQSSVNENIEPAKTLWDWLDLLIVSAMLAVLGLWFNRAQRSRDESFQSQRAEDATLEKYLDYVSKLLVDNYKALGSDISAPHGLNLLASLRNTTKTK
jgi:hypothetical protein